MSDTEAGEESLDVQCDNSSSSSSENLVSEIENFTLDDPATSVTSTEQTSENTRELQIIQPQQSATQPPVQISGGEFIGAQIVGSQTTHNHLAIGHFAKHEYVDKRQSHQTVHYHQHYHQESQKSIPDEESECIRLSDNIRMWFKKKINKTGNVFHGEQMSKTTGTRKLAIKSLPYDEEKNREAQMLTKLNPHKHVVSIVESNDYRQGPIPYIYIAMELCHTQNLYDHVIETKNNKLPFDPQLSISQANQLLDGISYIHENNIIHRDFKPHNVLLSLDKKTLKIADFGLSKPMTSGRSVTALTNQSVGTDGYRAPETYNSKVISKQADIYSLGLVFYFLWSYGCHPFGDDPDMWNANIKKDRDRDLSKLLLENKDAAKDLLQWALKFNPKDRPTADMILKHECFGGMATAPRQQNLSGTYHITILYMQPYNNTISLFQFHHNISIILLIGTKLTNQDDSNVTHSQVQRDKVKFRAMTQLKKQAEGCYDTEDYSGAYGRLKKLLEHQDNANKRYKILRQMAECQLLLGKPIAGTTAEIISTARNLQMTVADVVADADKYLKESKLLPSLILYMCSNTMIFTIGREMRNIHEAGYCFMRVYTLIMQALQSSNPVGKLIRTQSISCMCKMLQEFRKSKFYTVLLEARYVIMIAEVSFQIGDFNTIAQLTSESIAHMEENFGLSVCEHKFYGHLHMSVGVAYLNLGEVAKATQFCLRALAMIQKAEDFNSSTEKDRAIEQIEVNLLACQEEKKRQARPHGISEIYKVTMELNTRRSEQDNISRTTIVGETIPLKKMENESKELTSLRESADLYRKSHEYSYACNALQEILKLLTEPTQKIETLVKIAECKVLCDQLYVNEINDIISLCQLKFSAHNVLATAAKCMFDSFFLRACILCVCAAKMCKTGCKPTEALSVLCSCSASVSECCQKMISNLNLNMRVIATKTAPQFIKEIHEELCKLEGVAESLKNMAIIESFVNIASIYSDIGLYQESIDASKNGLKLVVQQNATNEEVTVLHVALLNNIGTSYAHCGKHEDAIKYFSESIRKGNLTDVDVNEIVNMAKTNLQNSYSDIKMQKQQPTYTVVTRQQNIGNFADTQPSPLPGEPSSSSVNLPLHYRLHQASLSVTFTEDGAKGAAAVDPADNSLQDAQFTALLDEATSSSMESPTQTRLRQTSLSATSTDDGAEDASAIDPKTAAVRPKQKRKKKKKKRK